MNKFFAAALSLAAFIVPAHAWSTTCTVSAAQYQKLETGMSYAKVVAILGCDGDEMSSAGNGSSKVVAYKWSGNGGVISNLVVMINQGKIFGKAKTGLN